MGTGCWGVPSLMKEGMGKQRQKVRKEPGSPGILEGSKSNLRKAGRQWTVVRSWLMRWGEKS